MADWNPALYTRFEDQRTRPAAELLARVDDTAWWAARDHAAMPAPTSS